MIVRYHRFHGYNSLRHVYQRGQTVRDSSMALRYLLNSRRKTFRVAVVVSRKVSKSAVVRNRIRRRLYELLRNHQDQITQPYDLVLTVFSDQIADLPTNKLAEALNVQLLKAKLIAPATSPPRDIVKAKES